MMINRRIAVLSNINMNFVVRMLKRQFEVYEAEGYGNELALLMNRQSSYHTFQPEITFFVMDLFELIQHTFAEDIAVSIMKDWVFHLEDCLENRQIYYISDAYLWGPEVDSLSDPGAKYRLEALWLQLLKDLQGRHSNVRIFPYRRLIERKGADNSFSLKTWYLGKILHTNDAQKDMGEEIRRAVEREYRVPKKVLVLDLDNTLWGGLAGENDHTPIQLSDDHEGLAYKNHQRAIRLLLESGVLLAIVSKNNDEDAMEIIRGHSHMVLGEKDFSARRINWKPKHENILEIAKELNLGTDSFVFWDDNPQERELVRRMLPEVTVPDFPEKCEELAVAIGRIYREYFEKAVVTPEDKEKTRQYQENAARTELEKNVGSFEDYLKQLQIVARRVDPGEHIQRLHQLVNKTNQFNLTTRRYEQSELQDILEDPMKGVYLYAVKDCFGDYGIVAAVIVDMTGDVPAVEEFAMSCRIMGKNVEDALLEDVEADLRGIGFTRLQASYLPTAKNKPVANLYDRLGYTLLKETQDGEKKYRIELEACPRREYYVSFE